MVCFDFFDFSEPNGDVSPDALGLQNIAQQLLSSYKYPDRAVTFCIMVTRNISFLVVIMAF